MGSPIVKVLALVAVLLALALVAGTLFGFATGSRQRSLARAAEPVLTGSDIFELGQVRTRSADLKGAVVAARISLPYPSAETSFLEELGEKKAALKAAAIRYLSGKKAAELHPAYEGTVKAGLRDAFNAILALGKIEEVWLTDFAVIE